MIIDDVDDNIDDDGMMMIMMMTTTSTRTATITARSLSLVSAENACFSACLSMCSVSS